MLFYAGNDIKHLVMCLLPFAVYVFRPFAHFQVAFLIIGCHGTSRGLGLGGRSPGLGVVNNMSLLLSWREHTWCKGGRMLKGQNLGPVKGHVRHCVSTRYLREWGTIQVFRCGNKKIG